MMNSISIPIFKNITVMISLSLLPAAAMLEADNTVIRIAAGAAAA